jgi:hypothetical protein
MQTASNIQRDGLGAELLDDQGNIIAEVFRCDRDKSLSFWASETIPLIQIEKPIQHARQKLGKFEDGTPFPKAELMVACDNID